MRSWCDVSGRRAADPTGPLFSLGFVPLSTTGAELLFEVFGEVVVWAMRNGLLDD